METDPTEHVRKLQEEVNSLKQLLAGIHQTQQQQFQLLNAFLGGTTAAAVAAAAADTPTRQRIPFLTSIQTAFTNNPCSILQDGLDGLDSPIVDDLEYRLQLDTFIEARDRSFQLSLPSQRIAMRQFMKSDYVERDVEEDPLSAFLALVGPEHKPVHVKIRDYYSQRSDKLIQHDITEGDEEVWKFLTTPVGTCRSDLAGGLSKLRFWVREPI